jgi:short subunit dehydrogenase-like uncharacterized protein
MSAHDIVLYGATGFVGQLVAEYLATSKILGEVGLCLALDHEEAPPSGGVLTPALGSVLRERLAAAEGGEFMQFRVLAET